MGVGGAVVFKFANGDVYNGEWRDDKRNGCGKGIEVFFISSDGARKSSASECDREVAGAKSVEMRDGARDGVVQRWRSRRSGRSESERRIQVGGGESAAAGP